MMIQSLPYQKTPVIQTATSAEQYVTLEIPSELISNWKREGSKGTITRLQ